MAGSQAVAVPQTQPTSMAVTGSLPPFDPNKDQCKVVRGAISIVSLMDVLSIHANVVFQMTGNSTLFIRASGNDVHMVQQTKFDLNSRRVTWRYGVMSKSDFQAALGESKASWMPNKIMDILNGKTATRTITLVKDLPKEEAVSRIGWDGGCNK